MAFLQALLAAFIVSLVSLVGLASLPWQSQRLKKILIYLVSFAAGSMMGGAFFHLLPEVLEQSPALTIFIYVVVGFCLFFLLEKILRYHHCHDRECETKLHLGYLNLVGDLVHNFLDGIIIVAAFLVDYRLGIAVTISIVAHEIPQEIGDFGVLLFAGFSKIKALFFNFLTALTACLGVVVGYGLFYWVDGITLILVPIAAGGFIYIATTDLIPELQKVIKTKHSILTFLVFVLALLMMLAFKVYME